MVSLRIAEFLFPEIKKERDSAQIKMHDLYNQLVQAEGQAALLFIENQKLKTQVAAAARPETPKIFKAGTSAEVRRATEQAFALVEEKDGV